MTDPLIGLGVQLTPYRSGWLLEPDPRYWVRNPDHPAHHPAILSENAQAARECASQDRTTDPEPGAFYGLSPAPDTNPHAHG